MVKIGIIGSGRHLIDLTNFIGNLEGFEVAGMVDDCFDVFDPLNAYGQPVFSTVDALMKHVDAVAVSCRSAEVVSWVCECLKNSKHVFLFGSQCLNHADYSYILKIAEESNVKFYPEFGNLIPEGANEFIGEFSDIQFVDINQTFAPSEGICVDGRLSLALLRNISFIYNFIKANVKKINANGWGFCEPGAGMINAKIDFDNGASTNLLLANSVNQRQTQVVLYGRSEIVRISVIDNISKVSKESISKGQLGSFERIYPAESALKFELRMFLSAIQQNPEGTDAIESRHKAMRTTYLIQEKINHIASINIFYS